MTVQKKLEKNIHEIFSKNRVNMLESIELMYKSLVPEVTFTMEEYEVDLDSACHEVINESWWEVPYYMLFVYDMIENTKFHSGTESTFHDYHECMQDYADEDAPKKLRKFWLKANPGVIR